MAMEVSREVGVGFWSGVRGSGNGDGCRQACQPVEIKWPALKRTLLLLGRAVDRPLPASPRHFLSPRGPASPMRNPARCCRILNIESVAHKEVKRKVVRSRLEARYSFHL
jgi:hypothetical protein